MRAIVYVDGFNLYYGCLKDTPYKWLDIRKLCEYYYPKFEIKIIKYFTARVKIRPDDPEKPERQRTYFRALQTVQGLEIIEGQYLVQTKWLPVVREYKDKKTNRTKIVHFLMSLWSGKRWLPLAKLPEGKSQFAPVIKPEEKGSDVNLASHLLNDAHCNRFDIAIIISNDSDLAGPIKMVVHELKKIVTILNPQKDPSFILEKLVTIKQIRKGVLKASQLPYEIKDGYGTFYKPDSWIWKKILIFTEGTVLMHPEGKVVTREERVQQSLTRIAGIKRYDDYIPIGRAIEKVKQWQGKYEVNYLTSRTSPNEIKAIKKVLSTHGFPEGEIYHRQMDESYADVVTRVGAHIIVEDDCESLGGNNETVIAKIHPSQQQIIKSIIVREFEGIDKLPDEF